MIGKNIKPKDIEISLKSGLEKSLARLQGLAKIFVWLVNKVLC